MTDVCYRTGAAAKLLSLSSYEIRRLAEAGLIEAEYNGKQWRFPASEIERLLKAGVPPIPAATNPQDGAQPPQRSKTGASRAGAGLLGPPSEELIASTEELLATENLLKQRKLERELAEVQDWFTDRESAEAEREAEQARQEQSRLAREQARRERDESVQFWEAHALGLVPSDAPPELRLKVQCTVREKLLALEPVPAPPVSRQIVKSLVSRLLAPWLHEQDIMAVLIEARDTMLPPAARRSTPPVTVWQSRAIRAAAAAIGRLPEGAPSEELRAVARQAVEPVVREFEAHVAAKADAETRDWITRWACLPASLSDQGKELAANAIRTALAALPLGTPRPKLDAAVEAALVPFHAAAAQLQAQAQAEQERNRRDAEVAQRRERHATNKRDVIAGLITALPWDAAGALTQQARAAVAAALDRLPIGAPFDEFTHARDAALAPFIDAYRKTRRKEALIAAALRQVLPRLAEIEARGRWDFQGDTPESLARQFAPAIRKQLELELTDQEPPENVARLLRRLVERQLRAAPESAAAA